MGRARVFFFALALAGCSPEIGDNCETSVDCSPAGDRLCDITQPGGYCTVYNCEPDTCPEESVCVVYDTQASTRPDGAEMCTDQHGSSPYQRSFCMFVCEEDEDCREDEGYRCIDVRTAPWGGVYVLTDDQKEESAADQPKKVCSVPADGASVPDYRPNDVCSSGTGGTAGSGASGGSGATGGSDAGGSGATGEGGAGGA